MRERAASAQSDTAPGAIAVSVTRTREGSLIIAVRYSYEDRPPSHKKRTEMARAMLREALDRLESSKPVEVGFSENSQGRVRTDRMEAGS
jgi:hypothetical protein